MNLQYIYNPWLIWSLKILFFNNRSLEKQMKSKKNWENPFKKPINLCGNNSKSGARGKLQKGLRIFENGKHLVFVAYLAAFFWTIQWCESMKNCNKANQLSGYFNYLNYWKLIKIIIIIIMGRMYVEINGSIDEMLNCSRKLYWWIDEMMDRYKVKSFMFLIKFLGKI